MSRTPPYKTGRSAPRPERPKKSLGQHFLIDKRVVARIVETAEISNEDLVLEVGPGRGILTRALADRAGQVVAVEIDSPLAEALAAEFAERPGVTVITADAREIQLDALVPSGAAYKLVANLPYYAATPIVRRFLEADRKPRLMVVMLQREVARRMVAAPGEMSTLSVATQLYGKPRIVSYVRPRSFRPAPEVTSAIVRIDVLSEPAIALDSVEVFFRLVRAGFSSPRKQLRNSLSHGLPVPAAAAESMLAQAGIDHARRAQTLSLTEWGTLYDVYRLSLGVPA